MRLDTEVAKLGEHHLREECYKRGLAVDGTMDRKEYVAVLEAYHERGGAGGDKVGAGEDRIMPDWTPPGVPPAQGVGVVALLRAFAASRVYEASTAASTAPTSTTRCCSGSPSTSASATRGTR